MNKCNAAIADFLVASVSNASMKRCAELFSMIQSKPKTVALIESRNGQTFQVRDGNAADVSDVTALIHEAFEIWVKQGLRLSPMFQTDAQTSSHLVGKGYVAVDSRGEIVGTFSLDSGLVVRSNSGIVFFEGNDPAVIFTPIGTVPPLPSGKLLVFKRTAVRSDLTNLGLGRGLYDMAEQIAHLQGYAGMILETVKETEWLFNWYVSLGYQPIGSFRYPDGQVDTILLIKPFVEVTK